MVLQYEELIARLTGLTLIEAGKVDLTILNLSLNTLTIFGNITIVTNRAILGLGVNSKLVSFAVFDASLHTLSVQENEVFFTLLTLVISIKILFDLRAVFN